MMENDVPATSDQQFIEHFSSDPSSPTQFCGREVSVPVTVTKPVVSMVEKLIQIFQFFALLWQDNSRPTKICPQNKTKKATANML